MNSRAYQVRRKLYCINRSYKFHAVISFNSISSWATCNFISLKIIKFSANLSWSILSLGARRDFIVSEEKYITNMKRLGLVMVLVGLLLVSLMDETEGSRRKRQGCCPGFRCARPRICVKITNRRCQCVSRRNRMLNPQGDDLIGQIQRI